MDYIDYLLLVLPPVLAILMIWFKGNKISNLIYFITFAIGIVALTYFKKIEALLAILLLFSLVEYLFLGYTKKFFWNRRHNKQLIAIFLLISSSIIFVCLRVYQSMENTVQSLISLNMADYTLIILAFITLNISFLKRGLK